MPVQVYWDDDAHSIIRFDYTGHWSWAEVDAVLGEFCDLIADIEAPVYGLVDISQNQTLPLEALQRIEEIEATLCRGVEMQVIVGASRLAHLLLDFHYRLAGKRRTGPVNQFADSVEEARYLIDVYRRRDSNSA